MRIDLLVNSCHGVQRRWKVAADEVISGISVVFYPLKTLNAAPLAFRPPFLLATLSEDRAEKHESRPRPPPFPLGAGAVAALVGYGRRPKRGRWKALRQELLQVAAAAA